MCELWPIKSKKQSDIREIYSHGEKGNQDFSMLRKTNNEKMKKKAMKGNIC